MVGIKAIATSFGNRQIQADDLIAGGTLAPGEEAYFREVGINTIYAAEQFSGYDMAKQATLKLMENTGIAGTEIDLIIYIQSRLPQYLMSSSAARLQFETGAVNAVAFGLSDLGCTDMTMAIKLGRDFLMANKQAETVLISYGNSAYTPSRFRFPVTINGDGGVALLLTRTSDNEVVDINMKVQGNYWDLFQVDFHEKKFTEYQEYCTSLRKYGFELAIESKIQLLKLKQQILMQNGLDKKDVQHFILQNLSLRSYEFYETSFDIKLSEVCRYNLKKYGHLGPADVMLNYQAGLERGLFKKGELVLIMNNSPVASWSNILVKV
jgi:3-oxoacyl-[acyl-carrier-protein] synthase III